MNTVSFNAEYINGFANAKAFIEHYRTLDGNDAMRDEEMINIYNDLKVVAAPKVVDHSVYVTPDADVEQGHEL